MSRIIVKNLPKNSTEDTIRKLFSQKGTLTDIQLKYTPDGKFRQFAFVGYQLESEAQDAIQYFDNMFLNTNKIRVENCALLGDTKKPKAWSKYAPDSTAFKKKQDGLKEKNGARNKTDKLQQDTDETTTLLKKHKDDPLFEEFLEVHAPEQAKRLRAIEDNTVDYPATEDSAIESDHESESATESDKLANQSISDLEYMKKLKSKNSERVKKKKEPKQIDLFTLKLHGLPYNCKKKDIKQFFKPVTPFSIRVPRKIHGIAYIGFKKEKQLKKALLKDRSFLSGKQISVLKYEKGDEQSKESDNNLTRKHKWLSQEEALKNEEDIAESGKIFVRNLAYTTTENEIEELFKKYGPLAGVNLPIDTTSKQIKGFGTITFVMPEHAVKAYSELDGSVLHGRMLHLLPGKTKEEENKEEAIEESSNYKKKKSAKQKAQAGSEHNWNSLFLGHDAVAEVMADTYNTSKENVLGIHSEGSAAVKLALGETEIVSQTRKYLEQEGVLLDTFANAPVKRSKTVILVKNLPSKTTIKEIRTTFAKFGMTDRVILPPSGITAIVEFLEPTEARKAFTNLAYTKFKNVPLYLEWAPENVLAERKQSLEKNVNPKTDNNMNIAETNQQLIEQEKVTEDEEDPEPDTTLFVKNLNFKTTDEALRKHFEACGKICYANVATKKDFNNPQNKLSMGYGFVRFIYKKSADKALKTLQQSVLDGKSLELKRSERALSNEIKATKKTVKKIKQTGTKILVRNVPFQANIKEIRELFTVFGEIKALRLPKKMSLDGGSHRGFAFVDYVTESDAKSAFEALSQSTHLYGRRLVLEWASSADGVEDIRKRTSEHFKQIEPTKKSKKSVFNLE